MAAGIGIVLALAVLAILGAGLYQDKIAGPAALAAKRNAPVAKVGSTLIRAGWYHKVLSYQQTSLKSQLTAYQNEEASLQSSKSKKARSEASIYSELVTQLESQQSQLPSTVLTQLIEDAVIRQKGPAAGLKFSPAAQAKYMASIYKQTHGALGFAQDGSQYGFTAAQFRSIALMQFRSQQMQKVLAAKVPRTQLEVHVRHVLVKSHSLAVQIQRELRSGGSWKTLAAKYSQDPGSKTKGGDYGWVGPTTYDGYVAPFKNAALHQSVGAIDIVHSQFGFHVMQVLGRKRAAVPASQLAANQQQALQTWLSKEEGIKGYVTRYINPVASALSSTGLSGLTGSNGAAGASGLGSTGSGTGTGLSGAGTGTGPSGSGSGSSSSPGTKSGSAGKTGRGSKGSAPSSGHSAKK